MADTSFVDAHLHFLDPRRFHYPWVEHPDFAEISAGYLPTDWLKDLGSHPIVGAVHVQAEVDHGTDPVAETAWLDELVTGYGDSLPPLVYVAYANLADPELADVLDRHCRYSGTR